MLGTIEIKIAAFSLILTGCIIFRLKVKKSMKELVIMKSKEFILTILLYITK